MEVLLRDKENTAEWCGSGCAARGVSAPACVLIHLDFFLCTHLLQDAGRTCIPLGGTGVFDIAPVHVHI